MTEIQATRHDDHDTSLTIQPITDAGCNGEIMEKLNELKRTVEVDKTLGPWAKRVAMKDVQNAMLTFRSKFIEYLDKVTEIRLDLELEVEKAVTGDRVPVVKMGRIATLLTAQKEFEKWASQEVKAMDADDEEGPFKALQIERVINAAHDMSAHVITVIANIQAA